MSETRTKNSFKNIIFNNTYQLLNIILNFVIRTIFIKSLGESYLGLNGLFTNILSILSLAEMGISTAMLYSMYKPIANSDEKKLAALIGYYKILYTRIALVVLAVGLVILPLLPYIVNLEEDIGNIQVYYLLYLLNSVVSYLLLYKSSIAIASQKEYLIKKYDIIFLLIKVILQSIILIFFKNYIWYLIVQVVTTILANVFKSRKAEKLFSFIKQKVELEVQEKKNIWNNIKSLLFYQVGNVVLNNTSNIVISILLGTVVVGHYSNYSMIITAVSGFTALIFTSIQSSIGNYNVTGDSEGKYLIYKVLNFIAFVIYGFCSISFIALFQDFITLWIGENYLLDNNIVIVIVLNYYIAGILYPNWCYRYTTELFNKAKYTIVICSIINIVLAVILGMAWGLIGVFAATAIARLTTTFWYEPYILYKNIFKKKIIKYFLKQLANIIILLIIILGLSFIFNFIKIENVFLRLIVKELICIITVLPIFFLLFRKTKEYIFLKEKLKIIGLQ